ncbi:MAG: hypothetical protein U5K81_04335 [Trueperaceae bacterium]|nr:hypothetical protein [Trueperaceae bacterium]
MRAARRTHGIPRQAGRVLAPAWAMALTLALAACGPLAADTGPRYPYEEGATYDVRAGDTLYVTATYPIAEIGLSEQDVRDARLNWIPAGFRGESANASRLLRAAEPDAPPGWQVRPWQTRMVRERPLGRTQAADAYRLETELRVDVPEEAYDLTRRVRVELAVQDGDTLDFDFLVRAR